MLGEKRSLTQWGKQCKANMVLKDKSLKGLSVETGYSNTYLSAILNNRMIAPMETVEKISKVLDVDPALY